MFLMLVGPEFPEQKAFRFQCQCTKGFRAKYLNPWPDPVNSNFLAAKHSSPQTIVSCKRQIFTAMQLLFNISWTKAFYAFGGQNEQISNLMCSKQFSCFNSFVARMFQFDGNYVAIRTIWWHP